MSTPTAGTYLSPEENVPLPQRLCAVAQGAWALNGSGTANNPYLIEPPEDWATFAANVNAGTNVDKCYKLTEGWSNSDNAVTATVGTETHPFTGTFDGNGKELNVSTIETNTNGADNTLYYPSAGMTVGSCRAVFQLKGLTAGTAAARFVLNFGDEESQGITTTDFTDSTDSDCAWYDLNGRKLDGVPTAKGLYIQNGRMVVVK